MQMELPPKLPVSILAGIATGREGVQAGEPSTKIRQAGLKNSQREKTPLPSRSKWGSLYNLTQSPVKVTNSSALYDSQCDRLDQRDSWCSLQKNANICRETEIVYIWWGAGQENAGEEHCIMLGALHKQD